MVSPNDRNQLKQPATGSKKPAADKDAAGKAVRWTSPLAKRAYIGLAMILVFAVALTFDPAPARLTEGEPAPRTYRAPRDIQYVDEEATQEARQAAREAVSPIYTQDLRAAAEARADVDEFFSSVIEVRDEISEETTLTPSEVRERALQRLEADFGDTLSEDTLRTAVEASDEALQTVNVQTRELLTLLMTGSVTEEDLESTRERLATNADLLDLPTYQRRLVSRVGQAYLRPTLTLDEEATELARVETADEVDDVVVSRQAGENIVQGGQIVTEEHAELLQVLGVFDTSTDWPAVLASVALFAVLVLGAGLYLAFYEEPAWMRFRDLVMIATLIGITVLTTRLVVLLMRDVSPYLLPLPAMVMLATLLLNPRIGLLVAVTATITTSLLGLSGGTFIVAALLVDLIAIVAVSRIRERAHLFYAGGVVTLAAGVVAFGAGLASTSNLADALVTGGYGLIGGLVAAILTYGLLPFFETVFRITTDVRLLELAKPTHPLLKRLMFNAPGSYNHSILTGNLAEAAAEEIGANALLARVGAYYHDVGKVKRPMFFVENQPRGENPHDNASPTLSKLVITAHVKDGVELAKEHKLPPEVVRIIAQHHGTSVVRYFFHKASEGGADVPEDEFRYGGEPPESAEAALVMLADAAEAAVRSIPKPTVQRIEQTVRRVVRDKLEDGQLDRCALTLADLRVVTSTYVQMLTGVYHSRIEYPDLPEQSKPTRKSVGKSAGRASTDARSAARALKTGAGTEPEES